MKNRTPLIVAVMVLLLVLPALYVGSYVAMVRPGGVSAGIEVHHGMRMEMFVLSENYVLLNDYARVFFWPLEQVDRRVRPKEWDFLQGSPWQPQAPIQDRPR